jgi:hypothetical protein
VTARLHPWTGRALAVLGNVGLAVIVVMALPLVIVILGAPLALLVRAILELVERF